MTAVLLVTSALLADYGLAMRAERRIAADTQRHARLDVSPHVNIGGMPYVSNMLRTETPTLSAEVSDITVPGFGLVSARTDVTDLTLTPEQVRTGRLEAVPAKLLTRTLRLDGVAMGTFLHITDLDISNPYDISPSGGPASEVQFTGTPEGFTSPVTVIAALRISDTTVSITPRTVVSAPSGREADAMRAFTWSIDSRLLPMPTRTNRVYCQGGSIYFESEQRHLVIDASDLSPISIPDVAYSPKPGKI
ncbi:DUF2993 domain-containing protein [Staphylococcus chromogenes]|nr:DUF2993 domain-containing protein [Staphylococcus chromogenes]